MLQRKSGRRTSTHPRYRRLREFAIIGINGGATAIIGGLVILQAVALASWAFSRTLESKPGRRLPADKRYQMNLV